MIKVSIYSDGSARGNPSGPGGYGTIVYYYNEENSITKVDEYGAGYVVTSNNKMELMGAITGLESLSEPAEVNLYSDSKYLTDAINKKWIDNWLKNGWKTASGAPVKNDDLWHRLLEAMKPHKVTFNWVKGHAGHPENERCDYIATSFADGKKLVKGSNGRYTEVAEDSTIKNNDT